MPVQLVSNGKTASWRPTDEVALASSSLDAYSGTPGYDVESAFAYLRSWQSCDQNRYLRRS